MNRILEQQSIAVSGPPKAVEEKQYFNNQSRNTVEPTQEKNELQ